MSAPDVDAVIARLRANQGRLHAAVACIRLWIGHPETPELEHPLCIAGAAHGCTAIEQSKAYELEAAESAPPADDLARKLLAHVEEFVKEVQIRAPESVYQQGRVIERAYQFIEGCCEIVGYYDDETDGLLRPAGEG